MSEVKDLAIKLFGKTIQLLHHEELSSQEIKKTLDKEVVTTQAENSCSHPIAEESMDPSTSSGVNDDPKTPTNDKETSSKSTVKKENPTTNSNSEEKPQKPDKILPCPRCNSMDTKFCYYNNYNINQPRHFCKNCQRYWTDGGTMRNTPVGSGRRKNKSSSSASFYRHMIVAEALQGGNHHQPSLKTNGSVITFGSDVPLCESMNSSLNLSKLQKNEDDHSTFSSSSASNSMDITSKNFQGYALQLPCFSAPPWSYPWNTAQYRPAMVPPTNLGPSGFPVSFYPSPQYWGCSIQPNPWGVQLTNPSPLGKHSRDGHLLSSSSKSGTENLSIDKDSGIPKTLRINDANEAAESSLWSTLGISKDDHLNNPTSGGTLYKVFPYKGDEKTKVAHDSVVNLQANPAALSRSLDFHETS